MKIESKLTAIIKNSIKVEFLEKRRGGRGGREGGEPKLCGKTGNRLEMEEPSIMAILAAYPSLAKAHRQGDPATNPMDPMDRRILTPSAAYKSLFYT